MVSLISQQGTNYYVLYTIVNCYFFRINTISGLIKCKQNIPSQYYSNEPESNTIIAN